MKIKKSLLLPLTSLFVGLCANGAILEVKNYTKHAININYQSHSSYQGEEFKYVNRTKRVEPGKRVKIIEPFSKILLRGKDQKVMIWSRTPYKVWVRQANKKWLLQLKPKIKCYGPTDMLEDVGLTEIRWITLYDPQDNQSWSELKEELTNKKLCPLKQDGSSAYNKKEGDNFSETKEHKISPTKYFGNELRRHEDDIE